MMDGDKMAEEILRLLGGEYTPERVRAFHLLCKGIVEHIQTNAVVAVTGVQSGTGTAPGTVT
jgi:hypothetical protein